MRSANVFNYGIHAGVLTELSDGSYVFEYAENYDGPPISLTMPIRNNHFEYKKFPPFFDGLLPEGMMLSALLKAEKLDSDDYFGQLIVVGNDLVGSVTVRANK
ncbi:MAG: HipA N-terminal domain-containing protein [Pseudomonadota bacterium]|nr:HipA N-terminal domain-containing protein [Pseudomonadota bacterium]